MSRRAGFLCILLLLLFEGISMAEVIPSDHADEWGGMAGLGKKSFRFVVLSDTQPLGPGRSLSPLVDRLLTEAGWLGPDFIVHLGDSVSGYGDSPGEARREFSAFREKIGRIVPWIPFLAVPGNHDQATPGALAAYRETFGPLLYYDFPYGSARFVVLNGNFPAWMAPKGQDYGFFNLNDGGHTLPMVDWAREAFNRGGRMLFVLIHTPPYPAYTPPPGNGTHGFLTGANRDSFVSMLPRGRTKAVISGHEHLFYVEDHGGTKFITCGTGGGPLSGPATGPSGVNAGVPPKFNTLKGDPEIDQAGGAREGLFRSGALGIFAFLVVTIEGDSVSYSLAVPFTLEVSLADGGDGISPTARAVLENRGRFSQTLRGIRFLMPVSHFGYALRLTVKNGDRKDVEIGPVPEVLDVTPAGGGTVLVRVQAVVPAAMAADLWIEAR